MHQPGPEPTTDDAGQRDRRIDRALRRATDITPDAWAVFEAVRDEGGRLLDLRLAYGNPAYFAIAGFDPGTSIGRTLDELAPGIDRTIGLMPVLVESLETGRVFVDRHVRTISQVGPDAGRPRVMEVELSVVDDTLAAGFRDVTDDVTALERERAAEEQVAASLARFEALVEQAPIGIVVFDELGEVRFNQAAKDLFGRPTEELVAMAMQPDAPWIPADQQAEFQELRSLVAERQRAAGRRFAIVRPDGERREVEGTAIPFATASGTGRGVVMVLFDLTERQLVEAQLRHAQKMEALGRLAGGIAHDFNNVLMAISGFAAILTADLREGRADLADAEQIVAATDRAIDLTARLTRFSRQEAERRETLGLDAVAEGVLPLIRRLAPATIEIVTDLQAGPAVLLDRSEFEQVILNLVVNAIDAMPDGGRLTIETGPIEALPADGPADRAAEGPRVVLAIGDSGSGMTEATRSRIFEPFYTTKPVGTGTGLGLAMVYAAVERADGTIRVESEPGRGTVITIELPSIAEPVAPPAGQTTGPTTPGGHESILLLEDDTLVRELVTRVLRAQGYEVTVASHPADALEQAERRPFDLLLSDVVLPGMTGPEVAARIRAGRPGLPVVLMSGDTGRVEHVELTAGDQLLYKPFGADALAAAVRAALDAPDAG